MIVIDYIDHNVNVTTPSHTHSYNYNVGGPITTPLFT